LLKYETGELELNQDPGQLPVTLMDLQEMILDTRCHSSDQEISWYASIHKSMRCMQAIVCIKYAFEFNRESGASMTPGSLVAEAGKTVQNSGHAAHISTFSRLQLEPRKPLLLCVESLFCACSKKPGLHHGLT